MSEEAAEAATAGSRPRNTDVRSALVGAARRIAVRDGVDRVRLGLVADEVGLARSTAYGCFASRLELLQSIIAEDLEELARFMREARGLPEPRKVPPPPSRIVRYELPANLRETSEPSDQDNGVLHQPVGLSRDDIESRVSEAIEAKSAAAPDSGSLTRMPAFDSARSTIEHLERSIEKIENGYQERFERRLANLERGLASLDERTQRGSAEQSAGLASLRAEVSGLNTRSSTAEKIQQETMLRLAAQIEDLTRQVHEQARLLGESDHVLVARVTSANDSAPPPFGHRVRVDPEGPTEPEHVEAAGDSDDTLLLEAKDMLPSEPESTPLDASVETIAPAQTDAPAHVEALAQTGGGEADVLPPPVAEHAELIAEAPRAVDYISAARRAAMSSVTNQPADSAGARADQRSRQTRLMAAGVAVTALLLGGAAVSLRHVALQAPSNPPMPAQMAASDGVTRKHVREATALQVLTPLDRVTNQARAGNPDAELTVGLKYLSGDGIPKDEGEAFRWISRAAQAGNATAEGWMGTFYARGKGVAADPAQAFGWFQKAAQQGNRKAMHDLANAYAEGNGVAVNYFEAARWFSRAADLGYVDSAFNLAVLYERGDGVPQSLLDAYKWYAIAAGEGDQESRTRMTAIASELSPDNLAAAQHAAAAFRTSPEPSALPKT